MTEEWQAWQVKKEQANALISTGFLPKAVNTPEKAIAIMMKGQELGMQTMQSFSHLHVINGVVTISAEGMLALVFKHYPQTRLEYVRNDDEICTIQVTKPGNKPNTFSFSIADAEKAQLTTKDNWKKFRRAMLRSRCISEMCRALFPDAIQGCSYTPEEILDMEPDHNADAYKISETNETSTTLVSTTPRPSLRMLFANLGISEDDLAEYLGKPLDGITAEDKKKLEILYSDIESGKIDKESIKDDLKYFKDNNKEIEDVQEIL